MRRWDRCKVSSSTSARNSSITSKTRSAWWERDMPVITIDDKQIEVASGATVMDAAREAGIYIPHFCYHKKLSIAASCRMCLVEVDKVAKPLPACATPVTDGMVVRSHSDKAVQAQKGVMEFLLIN